MEPIYIEHNILKALLLTAGKNDARIFLNGIQVEYSEKGVLLVTIDGHRISVARVDYVGDEFDSFIVPRTLIEGAKGKAYHPCRLSCDQGIVFFTHTAETRARKLEGTYPQWRRIIPREFSGEAAVFNPTYYGDLGKAEKLLGMPEFSFFMRLNGEKPSLYLPNSDFAIYIMGKRAPDKWVPFETPEWIA